MFKILKIKNPNKKYNKKTLFDADYSALTEKFIWKGIVVEYIIIELLSRTR